jgi:hypothetical protein
LFRESKTPLVRRSGNHDRIDLAKYKVDAARDARHKGARRHRNKPCHQRVLDKILTAAIAPDLPIQGNPNYL